MFQAQPQSELTLLITRFQDEHVSDCGVHGLGGAVPPEGPARQ